MKGEICDAGGCLRDAVKEGLCAGHRNRKRRGQPLDMPLRTRHRVRHPCSVGGCGRVSVARGLCGTHYQRWARAAKLGDNSTRWRAPLLERVKLEPLPGRAMVHPATRRRLEEEAKAMGLPLSAMIRLALKVWADGLVEERYQREKGYAT